jgi:hypothetical protein
VVFLVVMAALGLVASPWALLVPLVFVAGALCFAVLGMAYTALASSIEHFNIFFTGLLTPMFLVRGDSSSRSTSCRRGRRSSAGVSRWRTSWRAPATWCWATWAG